MSKTTAFFLGILTLFLAATPARALVEATGSAATGTTSGTLRVQRISQEKIVRIRALGDKMATRMQAAIDRMRALVKRIESRLSKLQTKPKETKQFQAWIKLINTNLDSAQTALGKLRRDLTALSPEADPKVARQQLQLDTKMVKDALTTAHTTMKQTVQALVASASASPSPTPSVTNPPNI